MSGIKLNPLNGEFKFSPYDIKQMEKVAVLSMVGDKQGAKEAFDEFAADKKGDKFRGAAIGLGTLAGAVALRKQVGGKATKVVSAVGDVIADLFRKAGQDGKKVVSDFLDKDILANSKLKKGVKGFLHKIIKNEDYYNKVVGFLGDKISKISKKLKIEKVQDIAEIGAAAAIGMIADEPIKAVADRADEGIDENIKIDNGEDFKL